MEIGKPVYSDELLHYQVKGAHWGVRPQHYPDPKQPDKHAIEFVAGYIREKAYAESTDDIGDLMSAWESFDYYDVTDKLNRELKKQQQKQS